MPNVIAAEKDVSATSPQSVVTDLPMVASPTAVVVASDVAAEAGIGATGLSPTLVEAHLEARGLDESVGLYDITRERARYQAVAHLDCLETSTIAIKAELYSQVRVWKIPFVFLFYAITCWRSSRGRREVSVDVVFVK